MKNNIWIKENILYISDSRGFYVQMFELIHPLSVTSVICNYCRNKIYDLRKIDVTHQYHDCDEYTTPCCGHVTDTRPFGDIESLTGMWTKITAMLSIEEINELTK